MIDQLTADAIVEDRQETADRLFQEYRVALVVAQTSHDPDDWLKAGSIFKRFAAAAVAADPSYTPRKPV